MANNGYNVTFSHKRNKKLQGVNLQEKRVFWSEKQRWVSLKISTRVRRNCNPPCAAPFVPRCLHDAAAAEHTVSLTLHRSQAMKTIEKKGLEAMAKEVGLDLNSLPYRCKQIHACKRTSAVGRGPQLQL